MRAAAAKKAEAKAPPTAGDWRSKLKRNGRGEVLGHLLNAYVALKHAPAMVGCFRYNEFAQRPEFLDGETWRAREDNDDSIATIWLQAHGINVRSSGVTAEAAQMVAREHKVHPVRDWLESLTWDGKPRLDGMLETYFGAITTDGNRAYVRAISRKFMISLVARTYRPGCKVDHMPIAIGKQGQGRSTMLRMLAHHDDWFADEIAALGTKDAAQDLRGKLLIEVAELSSVRKSAVEAVKAFLSRQVDHFRPAYGKLSQDFPRSCGFFGTTNEAEPLKDETGGRRNWVFESRVRTHAERDAAIAALRLEHPQLWAEAVVAFKAGETLAARCRGRGAGRGRTGSPADRAPLGRAGAGFPGERAVRAGDGHHAESRHPARAPDRIHGSPDRRLPAPPWLDQGEGLHPQRDQGHVVGCSDTRRPFRARCGRSEAKNRAIPMGPMTPPIPPIPPIAFLPIRIGTQQHTHRGRTERMCVGLCSHGCWESGWDAGDAGGGE